MIMEVSRRGRSMFPFTESQWQELELQALIFKYISSGLPIPSDLIFYVNNIPPGGGRRGAEEDAEPWRCRRTDGKKWRCAKEAYPDSKYCERHMHRGKNRSRKLVELSLSTSNSTPPTAAVAAAASPSPSPSPSSSSSPSAAAAVLASQNQHLPFPCLVPSNPPPPVRGRAQPCNKTAHLYSEALSAYSADHHTSYRALHGLRKDINEYPFFTGGMSSMGEPNQNPVYMQSSDCTLTPNLSSKERNQFYFFLGSDVKSEKPMKIESEEGSHKPRNFHLFIQ